MYVRYLRLVQVFFIAILPDQLFFSYFFSFLITGISSLYHDTLPIFSLLLLRLCSGDAVSKAHWGLLHHRYLGMYGFVEFFKGMLVEGMFMFYILYTNNYTHISIYKVDIYIYFTFTHIHIIFTYTNYSMYLPLINGLQKTHSGSRKLF